MNVVKAIIIMGCTLSHGAKGDHTRRRSASALQVIAPDPDLGWRLMPRSIASTVNPNQFVSFIDPETGRFVFSEILNSYPLYPEGPRLCFFNDRSGQFFAVDLATLAINISVRAEKLARQFGVAPSEAAQNSGVAIVENNNSLSTTTTVVVSSSQHNTTPTNNNGQDDDPHRSSPKVYELLRVPDCGWTLTDRSPAESNSESRRASGVIESERGGDVKVRQQHLERIGGLRAAVDVPTVGMNIAEQLHRLERKQDASNPLPFSAFGWKVNLSGALQSHRVQVTSPAGELLYLVPEELIMNVTQWVQQTYFTSAAF